MFNNLKIATFTDSWVPRFYFEKFKKKVEKFEKIQKWTPNSRNPLESRVQIDSNGFLG